MADKYANYADLAANETEGVDYERRTVPVTGATWTSIAIHGGGIEIGSGEAARAVGAGLMSHYEFAGLKASGNSDLHITSTHFDEPMCVDMVTAARRCISFHGYVGPTGVAETSLGGSDTVTGERIRTALRAAGFRVIDAAQEIGGNDPANIANRTKLAVGVQLEMSRAQRQAFFPGGDWSRSVRDSGQRTDAFNAYVAAVRSVFDGRGVMSMGTINSSRWATLPFGRADVDLVANLCTDKLAAGGPHFLHLAARYADTNNNYLARVAFNTDQSVSLTIRKRVAGTETLLANLATTGLTHVADRMFTVRFQITGSTLKAKIWTTGTAEPPTWALTTTDTSITAAGRIGIRSILSSANTNTLPVAASYDGFRQLTPQRMRVIRSVNGIVKPQKAGTPVRLAYPSVIAL